MIKRWNAFLVAFALVALCGCSTSARSDDVGTSTPSVLDHILAQLQTQTSPAQYQIVADAIQASPSLARQMKELAQTGLLAGISIRERTPEEDKTFGAWRSGSEWIFTPTFLQAQSKRRLFDVVYQDDILPNNMVFVLGHLAYHTDHAAELRGKIEALKRQTSGERTERAMQYALLRLRDEASAFTQGWNDVVDAAVRDNNGSSLSARQTASLVINLRYRSPLLQTARKNSKLLGADGRIEPNDRNLAILMETLKNTTVMDVE